MPRQEGPRFSELVQGPWSRSPWEGRASLPSCPFDMWPCTPSLGRCSVLFRALLLDVAGSKWRLLGTLLDTVLLSVCYTY